MAVDSDIASYCFCVLLSDLGDFYVCLSQSLSLFVVESLVNLVH